MKEILCVLAIICGLGAAAVHLADASWQTHRCPKCGQLLLRSVREGNRPDGESYLFCREGHYTEDGKGK